MTAHADVVKKFADRKVNRRTGTVSWEGCRVYCQGDTLYSYGSHFPLARYLGEKDGSPLFLKNGDKYSSSTSGHQSITQQYCKGPTVSRTALQAAGIDFYSVGLPGAGVQNPRIRIAIVDFRQDSSEHLYQDPKNGKLYREHDYESGQFSKLFQKPKQGMFVRVGNSGDEGYNWGYWHILGAVVLTDAQQRSYLCSLDEGRYFVSLLPKYAETVEEAFQILKPEAVVKAEKAKLNVKRQGEWFFIPTKIKGFAGLKEFFDLSSVTAAQRLATIQVLPRQTPESNRHICRQFKHEGTPTLACGKVRHWWSNLDQATGEHKTVDLGDEWHEVHRNTEVNSWSAGGKFD